MEPKILPIAVDQDQSRPAKPPEWEALTGPGITGPAS
jgi:hypothetical protein